MRRLYRHLRPVPSAFWREIRALELRGDRFNFASWRAASVMLAITIATLLQLDNLVWAAFSGFMVMRTELNVSVLRGINRIIGTMCGALVGLLGAIVSANHPIVMMAILFFVSWITIMYTFFSRFSYAWLFFYLTVSMVLTCALTDPNDIIFFAGTRAAEITIGTLCSLVICALRAKTLPRPVLRQSTVGRAFNPIFVFNEMWLERYWILVGYAARIGIAVALQPLLIALFSDSSAVLQQSLTTVFVVMMTASDNIYKGQPSFLHSRIVFRIVGCIAGSLFGILLLSLFEQNFLVLLLFTPVGILIGSQIEHGEEKIGYVGTQFALAFMMTYIQGASPADSLTPGLERLVGILYGCVTAYVVIECWPLGLSLLKYKERHPHHFHHYHHTHLRRLRRHRRYLHLLHRKRNRDT